MVLSNYKEYMDSNEWKSLRKLAYQRAKHKCELCLEKASSVHHVKYPKIYKEDCLDNLVVVCDKCHKLLHGIRGLQIHEKIKFCIQNGYLVEQSVLELEEFSDLDKIKKIFGDRRIITMENFKHSKDKQNETNLKGE
ncbi:MAG: HNH endonuclease [Alphaproteobacteria bacterium]|nr:MAG: HNH endonuclease [Alphaproteobacteria bacterium]